MYFPVILYILLLVVQPNAGHRIPLQASHVNCTVKHETLILNEDEKLVVGGKLYKVEDCLLQRAYQACGTQLWFMLNIVCAAVESQKVHHKIHNHVPRFTRENLLSEACCQNSCTVNEMTRYCPW